MPGICRSELIDNLAKSSNTLTFLKGELDTGRERLIRSRSSARFSFELSGNSN